MQRHWFRVSHFLDRFFSDVNRTVFVRSHSVVHYRQVRPYIEQQRAHTLLLLGHVLRKLGDRHAIRLRETYTTWLDSTFPTLADDREFMSIVWGVNVGARPEHLPGHPQVHRGWHMMGVRFSRVDTNYSDEFIAEVLLLRRAIAEVLEREWPRLALHIEHKDSLMQLPLIQQIPVVWQATCR